MSDGVARLQHSMGNHGLRRLLRSSGLQPKLTVGPADNEYEREAGRVADEVMRMPDPAAGTVQRSPIVVQGMCAECEEEQPHRHPIQSKTTSLDVPDVSLRLGSYLAATRGGGTPLSPAAREFFEPQFGREFGHVRVHTDERAAEASSEISGRAFTLGSDIYFARGQYRPGTEPGDRLLGHELTHVVHQGKAVRQLRRQPETCPDSRHEQADHAQSCPGIRRERGEKRRFDSLGPRVRTVRAFDCYVIENFKVGAAEFGVLRALEQIADFLLLNPDVTMHLTGVTDCLGDESANANLRTVEGEISCTRQGPQVTVHVNGSQFPSHRVFVNGANRGDDPQGAFAHLWEPDATDAAMVR